MQFTSLFRRRAIMKAAGIVQLRPERPGVINMGQNVLLLFSQSP
ncbi:hypothetical protein [Enterobacter cloacae complex sp. 288G10]